MSQGLSVQVLDADYVIHVTTYLLWFFIQCFLPILFCPPLFFCIFFILISVVSFFPVLFQILSSVISFILLLHLPSPLYFFLVFFFFDKYFSLRHSASWLVHAPVWHSLVNRGAVIKQLSRHLSQTTGVLHRNLEKLPYLISLRYSKNISICESFCARKS